MKIFEKQHCGCGKKECYYCWLRDKIRATTTTKEKPPKTPEDALNAVCRNTGVSPQEIKSPSRKPKIVTARHMYCIFAYEATGASDTEIAKIINRHRTTVCVSIKKVKNVLSIGDKEYANTYYGLKSMLITANNYLADT